MMVGAVLSAVHKKTCCKLLICSRFKFFSSGKRALAANDTVRPIFRQRSVLLLDEGQVRSKPSEPSLKRIVFRYRIAIAVIVRTIK